MDPNLSLENCSDHQIKSLIFLLFIFSDQNFYQTFQKTPKRKTLLTYFITTSEEQLLAAEDDVVTKELHLPVGKKVLFKFRSQDIIHSAFLPHFRVQMNCVPGTTTQFAFTPTVTSNDMKKELDNELFEYVLLCNKICGNAHYNMQMKVVVESEEDFNDWMDTQNENKIINL